MYETPEQIEELQHLLDASYARAGDHTKSIITDEKRLSARQLVNYLVGTKHIVVGTVSSRGEPRVSPVDGHFLRGRLYFGTEAKSLRIRHLRHNDAVSACHVVGDDIAITVHGRAVLLERGNAEADELAEHYRQIYGSSPWDWGEEVVFARIEPATIVTFAAEPSKYPG